MENCLDNIIKNDLVLRLVSIVTEWIFPILLMDALGRLLDGMNAFGGTLSEYLEYIDVYDPASDAPPQPGSVRIMTVHASKGLEFPVVLMCGLGGRFRLENGAAVADGEFGFGIDSRVPETGRTYPSAVLLAARERKRRSELEEEMRILYVALRSEEHTSELQSQR